MVTAITTFYNPSEGNINNQIVLAKQVDRVIICDNSDFQICDEILSSLPSNIIYFPMLENRGLSCAFNTILKSDLFSFTDDEFIVFFDQDSKIDDKHIELLVSDYIKLENNGIKVGCLGPVFFNSSRNEIEKARDRQELLTNIYSVKSIITSSMMCRYRILKEIDFWNDYVFLDMADWDICWRIIEKKYLCCLTDNVVLNHTVGSGDIIIGPLKVRNEPPIREYYQNRDCLYLLGKKYTPLRFKIKFIELLTLRRFLHLCVLHERRKRRKYMNKGIQDYFKHRYGSYTSNHPQENK